MFDKKQFLWLNFSALISAIILASNTAIASEKINDRNSNTLQIANGTLSIDNTEENPMEQVPNVDALRDVSPGDWAYQALSSLIDNYGCIAGYPNGTFRGNRSMTRYEFAAGLNACLDKIQTLIASNQQVVQNDLDTIKKLVESFQAELTALGARVDGLENRVAFLENHQFSTTTKLNGEVVFLAAQAFGDNIESQATLTDRVRLQLTTSFTGKDRLYTRLTAGNLDNSFVDETNTVEGRFAFDGEQNNNVTVDRLHYYFPVGDKLTVFTMASGGGHHFYVDTFNPGLEAGGGGSGALSRFGERNPIYRMGLRGKGVGLTYKANDSLQISAGYLAVDGSDPAEERGLFDGQYSALAQVVFKPTSSLKLGLTYLNGYDTVNARFGFGATGTRLGNLVPGALGLGSTTLNVSSNTYGVQAQFDITPQVSLRAWGGFTDANILNNATNGELGDAEIWNYAVALAVSDLFKEGNMGAIIVGAEPYLGGVERTTGGSLNISNDIPIHIEALYKYKLNKNITITPGLIVLISPEQNTNRDTIFIGALRTTFSF
jgi:hypothetical protein